MSTTQVARRCRRAGTGCRGWVAKRLRSDLEDLTSSAPPHNGVKRHCSPVGRRAEESRTRHGVLVLSEARVVPVVLLDSLGVCEATSTCQWFVRLVSLTAGLREAGPAEVKNGKPHFVGRAVNGSMA